MKAILKPVDGKYVIELDQSVLEEFQIDDPSKPVDIILAPFDDDSDEIIDEALDDLNTRYRETMKRLAK